jgi:ABC-type multidrug transport system ATPase subunit
MGSSGCGKSTLLACILGMLKIDGGEIMVLGQKAKSKNLYRSVGFMPQDIALAGDLSVKETIYFFGNLTKMNSEDLNTRFKMLENFLELPHANQLVENCSGGQQRRISLAVAMVHKPELLILDEPTVGLDPLLREKIWKFMMNETRKNKLTVIITTHYIEEARHADRCGLMRSGILLAEDSPCSILEKYQCESLEEAFLNLCTKQGSIEDDEKVNVKIFNDKDDGSQISEVSEESQEFNDSNKPKFDFNFFNWNIMKTLMMKNYLQIRRQPS